MLIPILDPIVFVCKDLRPQDNGLLYFQDIDSYRKGTRFGVPNKDFSGNFDCYEEADVSGTTMNAS